MTTTETLAQPYYLHDNYVATYYALYVALEEWIATNIFRQDVKRVFMASDEYAFRRRFELTDTSQTYDSVAASSLQFPFVNYWPSNDGWQPDERMAANTASLVLSGLSHQTRQLRAMAVTTTINGTFYFDREDDARLAYETLLWLSFRERLLYTNVAWRGETLDIPLNVKLQELLFNPTYKESDWLQQNRIFVIKANFELRSYSLKPAQQPRFDTQTAVEDSEKFTLTEEVILRLKASQKLVGDLSIDALYNQNPSIVVDQFGVVAVTPTTCRVSWDASVIAHEDAINAIYISLSGREPVALDPLKTDYTFRKLTENSSYYITIKFITEKGLSKSLAIQITTPLSAETAATLSASPDTLVGITW